MTPFVDKLPVILILGVLVGTFLILRQHTSSVRVRLWAYGWSLVFLHFFVQAFETRTGILEKVFESIDLAALEISAVVFVVSLTRAAENRSRRLALFGFLGLPTVFHAVAVTFDWHAQWALAAALAVIALAGATCAVTDAERPGPFSLSIAAVVLAAGFWAVKTQLGGRPDFGVNAILTLGFGICGPLFWLRYPRRTSGVIIVSGGFLCWGAVFPVATAFAYYAPKLQLNPELWNVPKFFVAFGMVLALIEEKSRIIDAARRREQDENRLLSRLSQISSRLLAGAEPAALCGEIAAAITETSHFTRAALFLVVERNALHMTGSSGIGPEDVESFDQRTSAWTTDTLRELCARGTRLGNGSFSISPEKDEVLIPLVSRRGSHVGCLWLSALRAGVAVRESEIVKLEMLASDLAVTIENARLHHQLVRSEKLAALGQLVAGVAHELNNPLTGIMGYAELLGEEAQNENAAKRIQKLANESRRMKRIVDGLLRFARQSNPATRSANVEAALRDVVQLREYHLKKLGIRLEVEVEPRLPAAAIGEDELKQVLLNILNNAIDAVEESARREIRISASHQNERVVVQCEDSGPGFTEVSRALDPFYTTKPVGKGTGLGLSMCYGIMQECGGEISLANKEPYGASVSLEFPASVAEPARLLHA